MDRYVPNPFEEYDNSNLLENGQLNANLRQTFISQIVSLIKHWEDNYNFDIKDTSVYTGTGGAALLYWKLLETNLGPELKTSNDDLLYKLESLVDRSMKNLRMDRHSFLCGAIGPLTIKILICSSLRKNFDTYANAIADIARASMDFPSPVVDEVLFGKAGVLYALLFIRFKVENTQVYIPDLLIRELAVSILKSGQKMAKKENSQVPLVYYFRDKQYIGSAHGYAGIM